MCLNPCFNGRYSQRRLIFTFNANVESVLILVLMEDTLRDEEEAYDYELKLGVLILVLMEDTLRATARTM